jgi:hypothetical protein
MEKFGIEIRASKPNFSRFLFPKGLFLEKKLIKGYLKVGFCGERAGGRGKLLPFVNQGLSSLDFFLNSPKMNRFPTIQ